MSERKITRLEQEITRLELLLTKFQEQIVQLAARAEAIATERSTHLLAAVGENDVAAKKRLRQLEGELEQTERGRREYQEALVQAEKKLAGARHALAAAERTEQEEQLLELLKQRESVGHEVGRIVQENLLPSLRRAADLIDEMSSLAGRLGLNCPVRAPVLTDLLAFPAWAILKVFPQRYSAISTQPVEARDFRPTDFGLDPGEALVAHDQQFRRRLLKEIEDKWQAASEQVEAVAAAD